MIVVDNNIIVNMLIPGNWSKEVDKIFTLDAEWAVPALWKSEFRNVLATYIRLKKMSLAVAVKVIDEAELFLQQREYSVPSLDVLKLASESKCSAYDCEYVALAQILNIPLLTSDKQLLDSFPKITISIPQFLKQ